MLDSNTSRQGRTTTQSIEDHTLLNKLQGFSVVYKDDLEYREHALCSRLQIDGSIIPGWVLPPRSASLGSRTMYQSDQSLSATSSRPFLFSKLELTGILSHTRHELTWHSHVCRPRRTLGSSITIPGRNSNAHTQS